MDCEDEVKAARTTEQPLIQKAILLSWFTIGYNLIEGIVAISFGVSDGSVALAGFGADSLIEVGSAILVLWRFRGESGMSGSLSLERERRATLGIGGLFILLAALSLGASGFQLFNRSHPETTLPGILISALSLSFMFFLWSSKRKVGQALKSSAVLSDAQCSLACIKLSFVLFAGSVMYWVAPSLWWADSLAAVGISLLIGAEGVETIRNARKEDFSGGCCG